MNIKYILFLFPLILNANPLLDLVEKSLHNEQEISASMEVQEADSQLKSIENSYLPSLSIGANYINTSETRLVNEAKDTFSSYAKISYSIYDGGKKTALIKQVENIKKSKEFSLKNVKNLLTLNTVKIYYNILSIKSSIKAKQLQIEQLQADVKRLEKFLFAGMISSDKLERIRAKLALSSTQKSELLLRFQSLKFDLEELTGVSSSAISGSFLKNPSIMKKMKRDDIKAYEKYSISLKEEANSKKAEAYPQLVLENTYTNYDLNFKVNPMNIPSNHSQNKLLLHVQWKIFDFGATSNKYEASLLKFKRSQNELALEKRKANIRYKYSIRALTLAKLKINSEKARLKSSNLTFAAILKKFKAGLVNNVTYLDALSAKYGSFAGLEKAKNDYEIQKAEFYYFAGISIKEQIQ